MGTTYSSAKYFTGVYEPPKDTGVTFLTGKNFEEFKDNSFSVFEVEKGSYLRVFYKTETKRFTLSLDNANNKNNKKANEIVQEKYLKSFYKIAEFFSGVNFCIYAAFTGDDICIYDIHINENLLRNDDFLEIAEKFNLKTFPLYSKEVNLDLKLVEELSKEIKEKNIGSFYLKNDIELLKGNRSQRFGNFVFDGSLERQKKNSHKDERILEIARKLVSSLTADKYVQSNWAMALKTKKVELKKENLSLILSILVDKFIFNYSYRIEVASEENNVHKDVVEKAIKKVLPRKIIEILDLK